MTSARTAVLHIPPDMIGVMPCDCGGTVHFDKTCHEVKTSNPPKYRFICDACHSAAWLSLDVSVDLSVVQ